MNTRLRKEKRHQSQQPADTSHDDLKKKYESLQKDYKRVGQNQELTTLLEEHEKEAEELANLVIAELRAEVRHRNQSAP